VCLYVGDARLGLEHRRDPARDLVGLSESCIGRELQVQRDADFAAVLVELDAIRNGLVEA
jgi:hypothetical protein